MGLVSICKGVTFLRLPLLHDHLKESIAKLDLWFQFKRCLDPGEKKKACLGEEIKCDEGHGPIGVDNS